MLEHEEWKIFSQIRAKDDGSLPAVLTRDEVIRLLRHIRLRRYRVPVKLIYCCGLRPSECLSLTIHDIDAKGGKLWIRKSKGKKDRIVPIAETLIDDLRRYWGVPRHLISPDRHPGQPTMARRGHQRLHHGPPYMEPAAALSSPHAHRPALARWLLGSSEI
jgi:integrase/recombinase XerD